MPRNKQAFNGDSASTSIPAKKIKTESETFKECESVGKKKKTIRVVNVDVNNDDHTYGTNDTETQIGISTPHSMPTQSLSTTSLPARLLNDQINSSRSRFISTLCSEPPAPSSLYPPLRPSTSSHCLAQNQQRSVPIARHPHPRFSILRPVCPSVPVFSTVTAIPIPSTIVRLPVPVQPPPPPPKKKPKQRRFLPIQPQLRISELKQPSSKSPVANVTQFQASTSASNSTDEPNDTGPVPVETTLDPSQPPLTLNHFIRGFLNKHKITWGDSHKSSTLTQQQRIDSILNQYFEDLRREEPTTPTSNGLASVEDSTSASTSTQPDDTGPVPVERLTHFIHDFLNKHKLIWVDKTPEEMGRQSELGSGCQREQVNSSTEQFDMEQAVDSILRQCFGDLKKEISASTSFRHTQSQSAVTSNGEANGNSMAVHVQMQPGIVKTEPEDEADGNGAAEERTPSSTTTANKAAEGPADNSEPATMQQIMPKEEPNIGQEVGGEGHEPEAMVEEQEQSLAPNLDARKAEIRQKLCEMLHRNGLINVGIVAGDGFRHFARELLEFGICEANNPTGSTAFSGAEIAALLPTMDELRPLDGSEVIENGTNSSKAESDE